MSEPFLSFMGEHAYGGYRARMMRKTAPLIGPGRGRALDLGCGLGHEALWLAQQGFIVDAIDMGAHPDWGALAAQVPGRLNFTVGDASRPTTAGGYDLVYEKDMLHHADDPGAVLRAMAGQLRPGGRLVLVEANRLNPLFYLHLTLMEGHEHFTLRRLKGLLDGAGLQGWQLTRIEARVWPFNRPGWQRLFDLLQDAAERLVFLRPILCYHAVLWQKPETHDPNNGGPTR